jgi:hypothetical protein
VGGAGHVRRVADVITDQLGYPAHTFGRAAVPAPTGTQRPASGRSRVRVAQQVVDFLPGVDVLSVVNPEYLRACSGPEAAGAACH